VHNAIARRLQRVPLIPEMVWNAMNTVKGLTDQ